MRFNRNTRALVAGVLWAGLGLAAFSAAGCASAGRALGMSKITPDEFRVVSKPPLVVPPDYALRPPTPGMPRPQELQPDSQARSTLLGEAASVNRSEGENLLVARAGAIQADPLIRYVIDDEFGDLAHKEPSFADRVMFWRSAEAEAEAAASPEAVNPASDVTDLTGGAAVTISRGGGGIKLPGL